MKIAAIETHIALDPSYDAGATSSAWDTIVVEIRTDEGVTGIGEADLNPWVARECIEAPGTHSMARSLKEMLIGENPLDVERLWDKMYIGSAMNGRRGAAIHAMGALDIALHDLRGKILGKPCHELLGEQAQTHISPYASLQPVFADFDRYVKALIEQALEAQRLGFPAAKLSLTLSGPYAHMGMDEPHEKTTEALAAVRQAVGPEFVLMVDVQYAFPDADTCLKTIEAWVDFNPYFIETPLQMDDLEGWARVATEQTIPVAGGEWLATRFEFRDIIERGKVKVVQPDIGRVGGLTEALRVVEMARKAGLVVIPHLWKTGISVAAAVHLAAVTPECPFIEFTPPELADSELRRRLLTSQPKLHNGALIPPEGPGLGVGLDYDALVEFERAAAELHR